LHIAPNRVFARRLMGRKRLFTDTEKWCPRCESWKNRDLFGVLSTSLSGLHHYCKSCEVLNTADRRDKFLKYVREYRYGVTPEQYQKMFDEQGGLCALPGCSRPIACIDHDHTNDVVRGLLCKACNTALGLLGDDPERIRAAAEYVETYRGKQHNPASISGGLREDDA
jgi:Recombination endonuclease VII